MEKNKNLFLITSALSTNIIGINNIETRLYQTISTVNSIKANVKNAEIWILEASHSGLHQSIYDLFPKDINFFKLNTIYQADILKIKEDARLIADEFSTSYKAGDGSNIFNVIFNSYLKSKTEAFMLNKFFQDIDTSDLSSINRIYKISGRYLVSNNFDQNFHDSSKDKSVYMKKVNAASHLKELEYQINCTMWSIDASIINEFKQVLLDCEMWIDDNYFNKKKVVDLEHAFYKFLISNQVEVNEAEKLGVMGLVNNEKSSFFNA